MTSQQQCTFHFYDYESATRDCLEEEIVIAEMNQEAVKWIHCWPDIFLQDEAIAQISFPHAMMICGQAGTGKTYYASQWAMRVGASFLDPDQALSHYNEAIQPGQYYVLESLHEMQDEAAIFHLFNNISEKNSFVIFTSLHHPNQLGFQLKDLRSRLNSIPVVTLGMPDDELLSELLRKFFRQRQLKVSDEVIQYLLYRIDRSIPAAKEIVTILDHWSYIEKKSITIPFVREILEQSNLSNKSHSPQGCLLDL